MHDTASEMYFIELEGCRIIVQFELSLRKAVWDQQFSLHPPGANILDYKDYCSGSIGATTFKIMSAFSF